MKRLLIAADVDESLRTRAHADGRFEIIDHPVKTEAELASIVDVCDILVTRSYNRVSKRVIDAASHLELIAQGTSGTDNIDVEAARQRGIAVLNMPGENANAVAELVIGFMIALTRTVPQYDREMRTGQWTRDGCASRHELRHYRLGIVGLGQVGMRVSRLAAAFGMRVAAFDPYISDQDFADRGAVRANSLQALLRDADILTLHVPFTPETRTLIGAKELALLPSGAIWTRGEVLDTDAALDALDRNALGGLAIDVYDPEPPTRSWLDDPRLILTPHVAGCTTEAKSAIGAKLYEKIVAFYERKT